MRKLASILALVAVVAFAGSAMAELTITVEKKADPAAGLQCYWIVAHGATQYEKFAGFNFTSPNVHQANYYAGAAIGLSVYLDQTLTGDEPPVADPLLQPYDTHYLFNKYNSLGDPNLEMVPVNETNTKSGSPLSAVSGGPKYGMGSFTGGTITLAAPLVDGGNGVAFLQVVVKTLGTATLPFSGSIIADGRPSVAVNGVISDVPEPSTIALLVAGVLCLGVARFRRG